MTPEEIIEMADRFGLAISYIPEEGLFREDRNTRRDSYSVDDCMLVRTTEFLPNRGVVETPDSAHARIFFQSTIFMKAVEERIRMENPELYNKILSNNVVPEYDETYCIYGKVSRNTSHYTINGLVGSHVGNDFSGRSVIIMDPLSEHIDDPSLVGLRAEDTYFCGPVRLSENAMLLIPTGAFIRFMQDDTAIEEMRSHHVIVFEGNEKAAVRTVLNRLGYNAFDVNGHGYVDGYSDSFHNEQSKMLSFISALARERGISEAPHNYSEYYQEERQRKIEVMEEEVADHFVYVVSNSTAPEELKEQMFKAFRREGAEIMGDLPVVRTFIDTIGLEEYSRLTKSFNAEQLTKSTTGVNIDTSGKSR